MDAVAKRIRAQLAPFTTFVTTNGVEGFIGEVGWPNVPHAGATDAAKWNAAAEQWYTAADDAHLAVTAWSAWLLNVYELSIYGNESGGPTDDLETVHSQAEVVEAHPAQEGWPAGVWRGVNIAGAEFAHDPVANSFSNANPGTAGTDYFYFTLTQLQNLAARGVRVVRLPFRWERIQPTLGAALDTAELTRLQACVAAAGIAGLGVVLDVHNYARYHYNPGGGTTTLKLWRTAGISTTPDGNGEGRLSASYLVDLWQRLSAAFAADATVVGYDLMNEPHDLDAESGTFSGTAMYAFAASVEGWAAESAGTTATQTAGEGHTAGGALQVVRSDAAFTNVRANDAGNKTNDPGSGNVLSLWVKIASGSPAGTYTGRIEWQNASFAWQADGSTTYYDTSGAAVAGLQIGAWTEIRTDFSGNPITSANAYGVQIDCPSTTSLTMYLDDFSRGSVSGALSAQGVWEAITQQVVDAIAATGDDTDIAVPGYGWNVLSWAHSAPWITPPAGYTGTLRYTTHHYFDPDGSGNYGAGEDYTATHAAAVTAGYSDDADTTAPVISGVVAGSGTATSVVVSWATDEAADRRVEYGLHSQAAGVYGRSSLRQTAPLTAHTVTLSGLSPATTYRYRARSRDASGNLALAGAGVFTTAAAGGGPPASGGSGRQPAAVRFKRWLPPLYANSTVMDAVLEGQGSEFDSLRDAIDGVLEQFFVDTATWTLDRWEQQYGLPLAPEQTLTERRERLKSRIRGYGTATLRLIKTVADAYGAGEIMPVEDYTAYTLVVQFVDVAGVPTNLADLQAAVRAVVPAHLAITYEYRWSLWNFLDAAALTWDGLDSLALDWDTFDRTFVS